MKRLLKFRLFESRSGGFPTDPEEIARICKMYGIKKYSIRDYGIVDVDGDVNFKQPINTGGRVIENLPIRFGKVTGFFSCSFTGLTSLRGGPSEVGKGFFCDNNNLTTLLGGPIKVVDDYYCGKNFLTTLEGAPEEIGGVFSCEFNQLTTLEGGPNLVGGFFNCIDNQLTNLRHSPKIADYFDCNNNPLASLEGGPEKVGKEFWCDEQFQTIVKNYGGYSAFRKLPEFNLPYGLFETYQLFLDSLDVCNWIDGDTIYRSRLEDAVEVFGKKGLPIPDKIEGYVIK